MSMIGRNDPCYCGSGKKYKKCCLHKEEQTREVSFHQEGLIKFALENFQQDLAARTAEYVKQYPVGKDQEQTYANIAVCWEVFCSKIKDGKTPVELYVESVMNSVKPEVAEILTGWTSTAPSLYKVVEQKTGFIFTVKDIWTEQVYDVTINAADKPKTESALLGTLVSNGINYEFYVGYIEMPVSELPALKEAIEKLQPSADAKEIFEDQFPTVLQLSLIDISAGIPEPKAEPQEAISEQPAANKGAKASEESADKEDKYTAVTELVKAHAETEVLKEAEKLWDEYVNESKPTIRKEEIYAAALDYLVSKDIRGLQSTQAETAKKYGVSPGSLSSRYREMKERLSV
ncbi:SEC-C metal-binding domain-containing protein [Fictibacillus phosphorivorans]|uniref:SEC-C metal-binding domain-containing protein n=1 Tax=Fictibacillus phosphorivorans TaxID=1221500 RepID=UPI00203DBFC2|nr:SEC-C metal-binding domain-containing protein [Fictibacillus phosphorivorans]MCM3719270.1 SEC-C domain-containing protein [Fictibacillus phosphorivorans]MCM3776892.1 SEC-C domain-containing protein [Fictibacillus phosphorivorans]